MPIIPLDDDNPRLRIAVPWVTWTIIGLCVLVFLAQSFASPQVERNLVLSFSAIPRFLLIELFGGETPGSFPSLLTPFTYIFLHGSIAHLLFNMVMLWVFGDNVEDAMGHTRFLVFYLVCGLIALISQVFVQPGSLSPIIGASGAIAGVMGAYLVLFPRAKLLVPIIIFPVYIPAYIVLTLWMLFQVVSALQSGAAGAGIAWWAHIGGFVAGVILVRLFRHRDHLRLATPDLPRGITLESFGHDRNRRRARSRRDY